MKTPAAPDANSPDESKRGRRKHIAQTDTPVNKITLLVHEAHAGRQDIIGDPFLPELSHLSSDLREYVLLDFTHDSEPHSRYLAYHVPTNEALLIDDDDESRRIHGIMISRGVPIMENVIKAVRG